MRGRVATSTGWATIGWATTGWVTTGWVTTGWATTGWATVTASERRHLVARSPATVVDTERFIVSRPNPSAVVSVSVSVSATGYGAAGRQDRQRPDREGKR